jgi:hypothetical protein
MVKALKAENPALVLPVETPLTRTSRPRLSDAHKPLSDAVVSSSPVRSNVVRNVRMTFTGKPVAVFQIQRRAAVLATQEPGIGA